MNFSFNVFFLLSSTNSLGVTAVNLVYIYLTRGIDGSSLSIMPKSSKDRRSRWCHLSTYLVLHHTAWSAQKGMSNILGTRNLV